MLHTFYMMVCLTRGSKSTGPSDHGLKLPKSSLALYQSLFQVLVLATESGLTKVVHGSWRCAAIFCTGMFCIGVLNRGLQDRLKLQNGTLSAREKTSFLTTPKTPLWACGGLIYHELSFSQDSQSR